MFGHTATINDGGISIVVFGEFEPQQRHACRDRPICGDLPILVHLWSKFYLELASVQDQRAVPKFDGDFTENAETYDVILDVIGKSPYSRSLKSLKPNGRYLLANPGLSQMVRRPWTSMRTGKQVIFGSSSQKAEDLIFLRGPIEEGRTRSVIDSTYPLEQIPEAHRYAEQGGKKGNIAITIEHSSKT